MTFYLPLEGNKLYLFLMAALEFSRRANNFLLSSISYIILDNLYFSFLSHFCIFVCVFFLCPIHLTLQCFYIWYHSSVSRHCFCYPNSTDYHSLTFIYSLFFPSLSLGSGFLHSHHATHISPLFKYDVYVCQPSVINSAEKSL